MGVQISELSTPTKPWLSQPSPVYTNILHAEIDLRDLDSSQHEYQLHSMRRS
jgi:hypothetical protein